MNGGNPDTVESADSSYPSTGERAKKLADEVRFVVSVLVRALHADLRTLVVVELAVLTVDSNISPPGKYDNPAKASCVAMPADGCNSAVPVEPRL